MNSENAKSEQARAGQIAVFHQLEEALERADRTAGAYSEYNDAEGQFFLLHLALRTSAAQGRIDRRAYGASLEQAASVRKDLEERRKAGASLLARISQSQAAVRQSSEAAKQVREFVAAFDRRWSHRSKRAVATLRRLERLETALDKLSSRLDGQSSRLSALLGKVSADIGQWERIEKNLSAAIAADDNASRLAAETKKKSDETAKRLEAALRALGDQDPSCYFSVERVGAWELTCFDSASAREKIVKPALDSVVGALNSLSERFRSCQKELAQLDPSDMNVSTVYPAYVIGGEATTSRLGGRDVAVPIAYEFPFSAPLLFAEPSQIPPFLLRLLYAFPAGRLQIKAVDHATSGDSVRVLNGLRRIEGSLSVVASFEDLPPLLRDLEDDMAAVTAKTDWRTPDWAQYNAAHPESPVPCRLLAVFSLAGMERNTQSFAKLCKVLSKGPQCGVFCCLSQSALDDLDEGQREELRTVSFLRIPIAPDDPLPARHPSLELVPRPMRAVADEVVGARIDGYVRALSERSKRPAGTLADLFSVVPMWSASSADGLSADIGWDADGVPVRFEFGVGRCSAAYHALIGGATGSGKSNLLHAVIQSLCHAYSPDELELYLLDYKNGDEFKKYADGNGLVWLPHARMVCRHRDPNFAIELFKFLNDKFRERSKAFAGQIGEIGRYRKTGGKMPRILVVIDEFQVLFEDHDGVNYAEEIAAGMRTILKQGRSYGIHLVLATQSLASTHVTGMTELLQQIGLRLALHGTGEEGVLEPGNREASEIAAKRQCILNPNAGRRNGNIVFNVPYADPDQPAGTDLRERIVRRRAAAPSEFAPSVRTFDGARLPPRPSVPVESLLKGNESEEFDFSLLAGVRTDFKSSPLFIPFDRMASENLLVAGEDGDMDDEGLVRAGDVWTGLAETLLSSLAAMDSIRVLYYNPIQRERPPTLPDPIVWAGRPAGEEEMLSSLREIVSSPVERKVVFVENFHRAQLLFPEVSRSSFMPRAASAPVQEKAHTLFASAFNGTGIPPFHAILFTKNFGYMHRQVLSLSGSEADLLKFSMKRVAFNLAEDQMVSMLPAITHGDLKGPRRVWFQDSRTGRPTAFLPFRPASR